MSLVGLAHFIELVVLFIIGNTGVPLPIQEMGAYPYSMKSPTR